MLSSGGIEVGGYLDHLDRHINRLGYEHPLILFRAVAAALSSTVLDNDIVVLFIVVPLAIGLRGIADLLIARRVTFEALAVKSSPC